MSVLPLCRQNGTSFALWTTHGLSIRLKQKTQYNQAKLRSSSQLLKFLTDGKPIVLPGQSYHHQMRSPGSSFVLPKQASWIGPFNCEKRRSCSKGTWPMTQ